MSTTHQSDRETPLLKRNSPTETFETIEAPEPLQCNRKYHSFLEEEPLSAKRMPRQIFDLMVEGLPNMGTMLGVFYYQLINTLFARQIGGSVYIASYGMGITWFNAVSYSIQVSLNCGLVIQLSQAFGAKNYKLMQELYQRCQGILVAISLFSVFILLNTKSILMSCGIEEEIAELTHQFSVSQIPQIFATILFESTRQLLISQNNFSTPMRVQFIIYFVHPLWCYILTQIIDGGIMGLGFARCVSDATGFLLLAIAINRYDLCPNVWNFKYEWKVILSEWLPFLKIAIPIGCISFLEWIFFEIQTILVGMLQDGKALAGQTAFNSISMFFFMAPLGLSWTANSYLGNAVGEGKKKQCLNLSKLIQYSGLILVVAFIIIGKLLESSFYGMLVTDDEMGESFTLVYNIYLYIVVIGQFMQVLLNGVLRCSDLQNYAATSYFVVYYLIGIPLSAYLTLYTDLRLMGAWIGMAFASAAISVLFFIKIMRIDWDKAIAIIHQRVKEEPFQVTGFEQVQH